MKKLVIIVLLIVLTGCSSAQFVDSWKNPETISFNPKKALLVGITDNLTARKIFEQDFKNELVLIENKIGTLYIFNSRLLHRVTPIITGIRYSLVNWISLVKTNLGKQNLI